MYDMSKQYNKGRKLHWNNSKLCYILIYELRCCGERIKFVAPMWLDRYGTVTQDTLEQYDG
jgi:hypothetical protein